MIKLGNCILDAEGMHVCFDGRNPTCNFTYCTSANTSELALPACISHCKGVLQLFIE